MLGRRDAIVAGGAERRLAARDVPEAYVALRALQHATIDDRPLELADPVLDASRAGKRLGASRLAVAVAGILGSAG